MDDDFIIAAGEQFDRLFTLIFVRPKKLNFSMREKFLTG